LVIEESSAVKRILFDTSLFLKIVLNPDNLIKRNKRKRERASKFPLDISTSFHDDIYITVYAFGLIVI